MSRFAAGVGALLGTAGGGLLGAMFAESFRKDEEMGAVAGALVGSIVGAAALAGSCPPCTVREVIGTSGIPLADHPRFP